MIDDGFLPLVPILSIYCCRRGTRPGVNDHCRAICASESYDGSAAIVYDDTLFG